MSTVPDAAADRLASARGRGLDLPDVAALATVVVLLLAYVERSIVGDAIRDAIGLVHLDPALFRAGVAVLALLLPLLLALIAWRLTGVPLPIRAGRAGTVAYAVLLAIYTASVWLPALVPPAPAALTVYRIVLVLGVPLTVAGLCFVLPAILDVARMTTIFRLFLWVSVGFGLVSLLWVALDLKTFFGLPLVASPDDRGGRWAAAGFFVQRNTIGSFLLVVIPAGILAAIHDLRVGRRGLAWAEAAGLGVLLLWLALTFSRSSQLGLAVAAGTAVLAYAWLGIARTGRLGSALRLIRAATVVGLLAVIALAVSLPLWIARLEPSFATAIVDGLHGRVRIWLDIWDQTADRRWIGAGLFGVESLGPGGLQYGEVYTPHNAFLAQLAFFGLPGLVSFVGLLAAMLLEGWTRRGSRLGVGDAVLLGAIAGLLVQNLFEHIVTYPVLFSGAVSLILLGCWRTDRLRSVDDARA